VLEDVCATCNNVHLGKLDEFVFGWMNNSPAHTLSNEAAPKLLRWCAKYAFNGKRAQDGDREGVRPVPQDLPAWIIGMIPQNPGFSAALTWIPPDHDASGVLSYGEITNDHTIDAKLNMHQWLFLLTWTYPAEMRPLGDRVKTIVRHFPALELHDCQVVNPQLFPRMRDPDWALRALRRESIFPALREGFLRKHRARY